MPALLYGPPDMWPVNTLILLRSDAKHPANWRLRMVDTSLELDCSGHVAYSSY